MMRRKRFGLSCYHVSCQLFPILSLTKSSGSDASICVVSVSSLFFNIVSGMGLSPNNDFIFLKSCEGFICPKVKLLNRSCSFFPSDALIRLIMAFFSVSYGLRRVNRRPLLRRQLEVFQRHRHTWIFVM